MSVLSKILRKSFQMPQYVRLQHAKTMCSYVEPSMISGRPNIMLSWYGVLLSLSPSEPAGGPAGSGQVSPDRTDEARHGLPTGDCQYIRPEDRGEGQQQTQAGENGHSQRYIVRYATHFDEWVKVGRALPVHRWINISEETRRRELSLIYVRTYITQ